MTTVEVLRKARELYAANPSHTVHYPPAGSHCLITAINCASDGFGVECRRCQRLIRQASGNRGLASFNAKSTTAEVLAVFDRAIEAEVA